MGAAKGKVREAVVEVDKGWEGAAMVAGEEMG